MNEVQLFTDDPPSKGYLCFVLGGSTPSRVHPTYKSAKEEAARLAREIRRSVFILQIVSMHAAQTPIVKRVYLRNY